MLYFQQQCISAESWSGEWCKDCKQANLLRRLCSVIFTECSAGWVHPPHAWRCQATALNAVLNFLQSPETIDYKVCLLQCCSASGRLSILPSLRPQVDEGAGSPSPCSGMSWSCVICVLLAPELLKLFGLARSRCPVQGRKGFNISAAHRGARKGR